MNRIDAVNKIKSLNREPFCYNVTNIKTIGPERRKVVVYLDGEQIGRVFIHKSDIAPNVWEVVDSKLDEEYRNQGVGFAMYLIAMNNIFPAYLMSDRGGCSVLARNVYLSLERLDFVEKVNLQKGLRIDEIFYKKTDPLYYSNSGYRFCLKESAMKALN